MGTLREDQYTVCVVSHSALLRMTFSNKRFNENQNTHFELFLNCAIDEIMWKNLEKPDMSQTKVESLQISGWTYVYKNTL